MIYLSGATNDVIEPVLVSGGVGLMVQPGSGYVRRIPRYGFWAADNGCFWPKTYVGDEGWLCWLDRLPRDRCLFAVIPDVARRPDGSLGGDPVATWERFQEFGPLVREMGFPVALAAQNGIEHMANLREQLETCDCLFIAGSTEWKISPTAERLARMARNLGKWVHMGRCNSFKRMERARSMGCNSVDGTYVAFAPNINGPKVCRWTVILDENPTLPGFSQFETPTHPTHRAAHHSGRTTRTEND